LPGPNRRRIATLLAADVAEVQQSPIQDTLPGEDPFEICQRLIDEHDGRCVSTIGKSLIAEFTNAVSAVHCAVAIQQATDDTAEQIRLRVLESDAPEELLTFAGDVVMAGSEIHTTDWYGFDCLQHMGFLHRAIATKGTPKLAGSSTDAERIASTLELWLWGQGQLALGGVQQYLDELSFRYNRREMATGRVFYDLVMAGLLHRVAQRTLEAAANG